MWDEDYQSYFVIRTGMPLEMIDTQKRFRDFLFLPADEKFLDYGLLILETFGFEKVVSRFEELFLASDSPDESLRLASVFVPIFCGSKNKNEIIQRLDSLKQQVQNIRQYLQIEAMIYRLAEREDSLRLLSITPFQDDILTVLRVGCLKDLL
ncbi:MAG: hypothetical protein NZO16_06230 [Deltaproteobacteria bacterium]|nr:hypothetical protein [Deltaproteobacteria bacterium]